VNLQIRQKCRSGPYPAVNIADKHRCSACRIGAYRAPYVIFLGQCRRAIVSAAIQSSKLVDARIDVLRRGWLNHFL
jgi:hypothetical protein